MGDNFYYAGEYEQLKEAISENTELLVKHFYIVVPKER